MPKKPEGDLAILRQEIKRTESSVWYAGNGKNQVKFATSRFCPDCNSNTHSKEQCWGPCSICNKRGHKSSECRLKDSSAAAKRVQDEEEKKKLEIAKKAAKNRKKNEKKRAKAKAAAEAKKAAGADLAQKSSESSSESETDSPVKASSYRMARVGIGTAKRAILTLEDELLNMSAGQREEFGNSVFKHYLSRLQEPHTHPSSELKYSTAGPVPGDKKRISVPILGALNPYWAASSARSRRSPSDPSATAWSSRTPVVTASI